MDSLITAAARALAAGDALGALNRVALRDDPPALALRGIAMARLGDFERAKLLLRTAGRRFGAKQAVARARCVLAEAEIALASRDLAWPAKALVSARDTLAGHGDHLNAAHASYLQVRHLLLIGRIEEAERLLAALDPLPLPPVFRAAHELAAAGIAVRRLHAKAARAALARATQAAQAAAIPALAAEVASAARALDMPAARVLGASGEHPVRLEEVEGLLASEALVVDGCRHVVCAQSTVVRLASRPVLFTLVRALAEAWPADTSRDALVTRAFRAKAADESYRARLRVEMGRLRTLLRPLAAVNATKDGFALVPHAGRALVVLARPVEEEHAAVLALLADGEAWSSSALALALGESQRTVQRALDALAAGSKVHAVGQGRSRRWLVPPALPAFTTSLLLPLALPGG